MPRLYDLGEYSNKLREVKLIIGNGLCSNIYVVGRENSIIIDTGVGNYANPIWPQLDELDVKPENIRGVVITHAHHDHAMGAFIILERANPKIFVHKLDTKFIASQFGENLVKVENGDLIETELWPLRVIWTPGHSEGSICLFNEDKKILFSGDTVFPNGSFGRFDGDSGSLKALVSSLKKLTEIEVDIMLPGHGSPVFENATEHIRQSYMNASRYG
jgi:glyoxylase-like metal-dependent hydrolase (beta-lactamase superfamily II)